MCTSSISNVIYHKFSLGAAFHTLNGKNVNVMLESELQLWHEIGPKSKFSVWREFNQTVQNLNIQVII